MTPIHFTTELNGSLTLPIPRDVAARLPRSGTVTIIVVPESTDDDVDWRAAAYRQFLRDDSPDDAIYDSCP